MCVYHQPLIINQGEIAAFDEEERDLPCAQARISLRDGVSVPTQVGGVSPTSVCVC